ncbi:MAG: hypothetical protein KGJ88_10550, partial [Verrucomicrobiota bacterium]|nr:hypothetical protein [Verrucomicrobiota bacterium]
MNEPLRSVLSRSFSWFVFGTLLSSLSATATIINVSTSSQLASAVAGANPGDIIVMANGNYSGFTMTRSGSASAPITIEAASQGNAVISSGVVELTNLSYVVLQGLGATTPGGTLIVDGNVSRPSGFALINASDCRVTRCTFKLSGAASGTSWVFLDDNSVSNRVDHCEFGPNSVGGHTHYIFPCGDPTIAGVTPPACRESWADGNGPYNPNMARYTQMDHNYFHDMGSGDGEIIVPGGIGVTGDYQGTMANIEYNLFVNCNGDPEVISIKSSTNTVRFNTFVTCGGVVSFRSGNGSSVYGNFFLCGGVSGSGGCKINEMHHKFYDNYVENAGSYPIMLEDGDYYCTNTFAHAQVVDAEIEYNTVVSPALEVLVGHNSTSPLKPTGCVFANNILEGSGTLYQETSGSSVTRSQNISYSYNPGLSGFIIVDPLLTSIVENSYTLQKLSSSSPAIDAADATYFPYVTNDMDGQARDSAPDIGADEFSSASIARYPLTTNDVGPNAVESFSLSASPASQSIGIGGSTVYAVTVSGSGGFADTVDLSVSGLPSGATAAFSPSSVTGSGGSTLNVITSSSTPAGAYTLTISGTDTSDSTLTQTTTATLTVNTGADFSISVNPNSQTVAAGDSVNDTVNIGSVSGFSGNVALNVTGLPSGAGASFNPGTVAAPGTSTLALSTSTSTPYGAYTLIVSGVSGALTNSVTATLTVNPPPNFSLSATPASLVVLQGGSATNTITVNPLFGFTGSVSLSASGLPGGVTASFNPSSTTSTSTLTFAATPSALTGSFNITITGVSGSLTNTTPMTLTVNPPANLPAGWTDQDIGSPGIVGYATYSNGLFTVAGGGSDIWGTSDSFNYAYESISGDSTAIARVASQQNTSSWAKSGLMFRDSTAANAAYVAVYLTPSNGVSMQIRSSDGAGASQVAVQSGLTAPYWVEVVRSGNTFTGYSSPDGSTWTQVGSASVTMPSTAAAGLAVCAHNNSALNTSTFDNVSITGSQTQPPPAPTGLMAIAGDSQVALSWTASTGATSYNVKR